MTATPKTYEYPCVALRPARAADLADIVALLGDDGASTAEIEERLGRFWVAEDRDVIGRPAGALAGVAGIEVYGDAALLRSVAVAPAWRRSGLGRLLTDRALEEAESAGARDIVLLATGAEHYATEPEPLCAEALCEGRPCA